MPDITAVPEGLSVSYERNDHGTISLEVQMRATATALLTDADDAQSADWRLGKLIRQTQAAVRAVVAKWDAAEPAKHDITMSPRSEDFLAQAVCSCGWSRSGVASTILELASQEHLLENGIVR